MSNGEGQEPDRNGIGAWCDSMPPGTLVYPYKASTTSDLLPDPFAHDDLDDVFAVHMEDGWKFFQADRKNGSIFKMWGSYNIFPAYAHDSTKISTHRLAFHVDDTTACGTLFLHSWPHGAAYDEDTHAHECEYLAVNVLPFKDAYYNYRGRGCDEDKDIRKYVICSSNDRKNESENSNPWQYTIRLLPKKTNGIVTQSQSNEIYIVARDNRLAGGSYLDEYSIEQASRPIKGIFDDDCILHTSWGEWVKARSGWGDTRKFHYYEIDIHTNESDRAKQRSMMMLSTSASVGVYTKEKNVEYIKRIELLRHTTEGDGTGVDTVISTNNNRFLCTVKNHPIQASSEDKQVWYRIKLGDLVKPDDVITFIFDSCEGDDNISIERKAIKDILLKTYGTTIVHRGEPTADPLIVYQPDLDIMDDKDDLLKTIKEKCKMKGKINDIK